MTSPHIRACRFAMPPRPRITPITCFVCANSGDTHPHLLLLNLDLSPLTCHHLSDGASSFPRPSARNPMPIPTCRPTTTARPTPVLSDSSAILMSTLLLSSAPNTTSASASNQLLVALIDAQIVKTAKTSKQRKERRNDRRGSGGYSAGSLSPNREQ
jgi:hypothetical protein